jgi:hypothetical protein
MKQRLISVAIVGFIVPMLGCSSAGGNTPAASPALSNSHVDCEVSGGVWDAARNYCEYRAPGGSAPLGW